VAFKGLEMANSLVAVRVFDPTSWRTPLTLGRQIKIVCELAEPHTALARLARDLHPLKRQSRLATRPFSNPTIVLYRWPLRETRDINV
jgi:hypothetical protein